MDNVRNWKPSYLPWNPQEKIRIAIIFQVASYWPTIESFYREGMADEEVDMRIFFVDDPSVEKVQSEGTDRFLEENHIPYCRFSEEAVSKFRPHAALYQPPYDVSYRNPPALSLHLRKKGIRIVYIPYGIEIADTKDARYNHFFTFVIRNAWRIYTFSEVMKKDYDTYCPNRQAVRALGIPKMDWVCGEGRYAGDRRLLPGYSQAGRKRIIVWKMHFPKLIYEGMDRRQVTPDLKEYWKFSQIIDQYQDLLFVVLPHPMFFTHTIQKELAEDAKRLMAALADRPNVWLDRSADYRKPLSCAEAVIVDRSALMVEAGLLGVPVLYMKNADYEEPLTRAVKPLVDSFAQGTTAEDMQAFIEDFRNDRLSPLADRIKRARQRVIPYNDGKCGQRILKDIKAGVKKEEDQRVKVIFFGAGFICDHYIKRLRILQNPDFLVICLSDNDPEKWGTKRSGLKVIPPAKLCSREFDFLVVTTEQYYMPIKKQLVYELFLAEEKILRLDVFSEMYTGRYQCL